MKATGVGKFFMNAFLLLAVLFICDRAIGWWLEKSYYKQTHGDDVVSIYVAEKAKEDILILGGSRASHHYIPDSLEQQTGMSCFNGGRDDMDILYISSMLDIVFQRYHPKVLILDMIPLELSDYDERKATIQRASTTLMPFYPKYPGLRPVIEMPGKMESVKAAISHIYPYNSLVGSIFQNTYTSLGHSSIKGYEPLVGNIDSTIYKSSIWGSYIQEYPLDKNCVSRLQGIVAAARKNNIRLITVISPFYFPFDFYQNSSYLEMKRVVEGAGFEIYDFSHAAPFLKNPYLFKDDIHLNDSGAVLFSSEISSILKNRP